MRLIDADALWRKVCESEAIEESFGNAVLQIIGDIIDSMPTKMPMPERLRVRFNDYCMKCPWPEIKANIHNDTNGWSDIYCENGERCYKISQNLKVFYGINELSVSGTAADNRKDG